MKQYNDFITDKRTAAKTNFDEDLPKPMKCSFYDKTIGNVRNRLKAKLIKKNDVDELRNMQPKLTFNGIHKSYEKHDTYTFKHNEIQMDKPIY